MRKVFYLEGVTELGRTTPQTGALTGLRYAPNIGRHYKQGGLNPQHAPARRCRTARLAAP
jgi:hypothetical protein